jgi:hypothetical protein
METPLARGGFSKLPAYWETVRAECGNVGKVGDDGCGAAGALKKAGERWTLILGAGLQARAMEDCTEAKPIVRQS